MKRRNFLAGTIGGAAIGSVMGAAAQGRAYHTAADWASEQAAPKALRLHKEGWEEDELLEAMSESYTDLIVTLMGSTLKSPQVILQVNYYEGERAGYGAIISAEDGRGEVIKVESDHHILPSFAFSVAVKYLTIERQQLFEEHCRNLPPVDRERIA